MAEYTAPLRDISFVLEHLVDFESIVKLEPYSDVDLDTVTGVLEEFGRLMGDVVGPPNGRRRG